MQHSRKANIKALVEVLSHLHPLSDAIQAFLQDRLVERTCRKGALLLKQGTICHHLYFIKKGAIRGFIKSGEKDITTWISIDNEVVTSIASLNEQAASPENIQAIESCELLVLNFEDLDTLYSEYLDFNIVGRKLLQLYYHDAETRAFISRLPGAEEKYRYFMTRYPRHVNRIPIKYIASFLGLALETLSRTRKKISQSEKQQLAATIYR